MAFTSVRFCWWENCDKNADFSKHSKRNASSSAEATSSLDSTARKRSMSQDIPSHLVSATTCIELTLRHLYSAPPLPNELPCNRVFTLSPLTKTPSSPFLTKRTAVTFSPSLWMQSPGAYSSDFISSPTLAFCMADRLSNMPICPRSWKFSFCTFWAWAVRKLQKAWRSTPHTAEPSRATIVSLEALSESKANQLSSSPGLNKLASLGLPWSVTSSRPR
mmetsp:Transcript_77676/g.220149  ORF Transcript_77676/g.220149 Transcript_77676/m.220149 type:complete len:219 (+) Transcript_77676:928-1584(+)